MKINIWVAREDVCEINTWLSTPHEDILRKIISIFHDKPLKRMDVIQVSISIDEYQKIIDNNEEIQANLANQLGWVQTTTIDPETNVQLQVLFGD